MAYKKVILFMLICLNYLVSATFFHKHSFQGHISLRRQFFKAGDNDNNTYVPDYPVPDAKYGPFYMTMPLDHFGNSTKGVFDNRYWVNIDYYKKDGPIILYNIGESAADSSASLVINSTMAQLAEYLNGIVVIMEHRFYGQSGPNVTRFFNNTKEDISTFNIKQALGDMAYLIKNIKFEGVHVPPVPKTKAVVYGCSYSGNLAAWVKETYPELFFAAVSSSAPVQAEVNFYQYFDPIMRYGSKPCISALENVIAYVDKILFGKSTADVKALKKIFYAENLLDESFAELLMGDFSGLWQYGINETYNAFDDYVCKYFPKTMTKNDTATVEKNLISYSKYINNYSRANYCGSNTTVLEDCLVESNFIITDDVSTVSNSNAAWTWQTCTEFGYYQISSPKNLPTIVSRKYGLGYYTNMCQKYFSKFGVPKLPDTAAVNKQYQGWNVQLNRTIFIDGEWDSWRELSVNSPSAHRTFKNPKQAISIIVPKSTHCANVDKVTEESPQYLKDILMQQYRALKDWLNEDH